MGLDASKVLTCSAEFYCASKECKAGNYQLVGVYLVYDGDEDGFFIDNLPATPEGIEAVVDFKPTGESADGLGTALIPKKK